MYSASSRLMCLEFYIGEKLYHVSFPENAKNYYESAQFALDVP